MIQKKNLRIIASSVIVAISMAPMTHAALVIYEGFDYAAGIFNGTAQNGGIGFASAWTGSGTANDWDVAGTGLTFPGLSTLGRAASRVDALGNSQSSRSLSAAAVSALTGPAVTTIYFSVLMIDSVFSLGNSNGALVFGTGPITVPSGDPVSMGSGKSFGVAYNDLAIHALAANGTSSTLSTGNIPFDGVNNDTTYMIVGKIDWAPNGSNDTLSLYRITNVSSPLPAAFASVQADVNQSQFNTLSLGSRQNEIFDEIRFGTTLASVGIVPEPSTIVLLGMSALALLHRRRSFGNH